MATGSCRQPLRSESTTTAARTRLVPRYGSPAEIAGFLGVSAKIVRRAVAFRDADQFVRRIPTMAPTTAPPQGSSSVDSHGRALPMSETEVRGRAAAIARGMAAINGMGDEQEQREALEWLMKAVDEDRLSDRRRFG